MRICLVDPGRQVPYYLAGLAAALADLGDEIDVVTAPAVHYSPPPGLPAPRIVFGRRLVGPGGEVRPWARRPWIRRLVRGLSYPTELAGFLRSIAANTPDLVHWQWSLAPAADALALARLRRLGCPAIVTVHNVLPHEVRAWHRVAWRTLYTQADRLLVHSRATADRLSDLVPRVEARVRVVPMGAAVRTTPSRADARRQLGLDIQAPTAIFIGQVRPYKGVDDLVASAPLIAERVPGARVIVAGAGAETLTRNGRGVLDLRPGFIADGDLPLYFAAADVVVLPYRDTDDSAVLAEAQAYGRAIVATGVGGIPEAVAGGGMLVTPGHAGELAEAVAAVLGDVARRSAFESAALAAASKRTWAAAAAATRLVYEEVLVG